MIEGRDVTIHLQIKLKFQMNKIFDEVEKKLAKSKQLVSFISICQVCTEFDIQCDTYLKEWHRLHDKTVKPPK